MKFGVLLCLKEQDKRELTNLYREWKNIQPEGSSLSIHNYLEWLKEQRTLEELDSDASKHFDSEIS